MRFTARIISMFILVMLFCSACVFPRAESRFASTKEQCQQFIDGIFMENILAFEEIALNFLDNPHMLVQDIQSDIITDDLIDLMYDSSNDTYLYSIDLDFDEPCDGVLFELSTKIHNARICYSTTGSTLSYRYNPRENEIEWIDDRWYVEYYYSMR